MDTGKFLDDFLGEQGFEQRFPPADDHQLVAAVTSFQDPFLTQVQLAELFTGEQRRHLYVRDVITFPGMTPGRPNFSTYLLGSGFADPGTHWVVSDMYANTHGIHVHPVFGSADPETRPIGRQFERTQLPVRVGSEVRALVNTTEGIVYLHCNMPWKDEASERGAVSKLSDLLGKQYWNEVEFPAVSDLVNRRLSREGINVTQAMMVTLRGSGQEPLRLEDTRDYAVCADVQERQSTLPELRYGSGSVTYGMRDGRVRDRILASLPVALHQALN